MIKCLIHRVWKLSSNEHKSHENIELVKTRMVNNGYKLDFINKQIDKVLKKINNGVTLPKEDIKTVFLSIPFSEGFSSLSKIFHNFFSKNAKCKLISTSTKIISLFSNKSPTPTDMCSNLVYEYKCHGCPATYIGETDRQLRQRIQEHNQISRKSSVLDHKMFCNKRSTNVNRASEFKILKNKFGNYKERVICEALLIRDLKPELNVQTDCIKLIKVF